MEALTIKDLMLGDWVYILNFPEVGKKTPVKIVGIDTNHNAVEYVHNGISLWSAVVRLEPIPITPEILESNGFGYKENDTLFELHHYYLGEPQFCRNMDLHIGNKKDIFWIDYNNNHIGGIHYVHELQHALRLCKIEKEIEL